ncbi:hypothetical protein Terro_1725 [Terriglobus roseus DSM 18391]|uniref:Right handed beta helix domain-containing protein n=1 Tax=Terriglobus roseus (strain DSM 18391 / NRRL B-41598 / KBS 63) TaxID=926566 RepID=I3ZFK9_TERRK|nr:right-handed parallel beta-helix repeat-containing protein [Terriglobus roseus]AFL88027.1 hypothetical protein Terro_1725 [Terriglobus roseus DSM 18391]
MPRFQTQSIGATFCLLLTVCSVRLSPAATYYVDATHGRDAASGTSPQAAWRHLSAVERLAQARGLKPGDSVLLKSGERWREQFDLSDIHGRQGAPIRIASYGTGDYPTIDAADLATGWTRVQGDIYQTPAVEAVYKVFVDGDDRPVAALQPVVNGLADWTMGKQYVLGDQVQANGKTFTALRTPMDPKHLNPADWYRVNSAAVQTDGMTNLLQTAGSFWYDARSKRLLVRLADGSNPASHSIQITTRRYGVHLQGSSNVVVDGLRIVHPAKAGIAAVVADTPLSDAAQDNQFNTIQNSILWNVADTTSDFSMALNTGGEGGIYISPGSGPGRGSLQGWTIQNNAIGIVDSARYLTYERDGILVAGTTGASIKNNYVSTANALGISVVSERGVACSTPAVVGNYLTNNDGNIRISGCAQASVDSNTIEYSYGYGVQVGGNSNAPVVTRNVIHHIERLGQENAYNGFDCNGGAPGGTLSENNIAAVWGAEATFEVGCGHWTIERNIFDSSSNMKGGGLTLYIRRDSPQLQFRNNTYHLNAGTNRQFNFGAGEPGAQTFHDFAWWQQTVEQSAQSGPQANALVMRRAAVPAKTPAAQNYLRVAPPVNWEP